jgi:hypothetical protein
MQTQQLPVDGGAPSTVDKLHRLGALTERTAVQHANVPHTTA